MSWFTVFRVSEDVGFLWWGVPIRRIMVFWDLRWGLAFTGTTLKKGNLSRLTQDPKKTATLGHELYAVAQVSLDME